jgi:hypothetical protein
MSDYALHTESRHPPAFWYVVGLKAALVALLLLPLTNPGWQQHDDKGMHWRMLAFPVVALVVPVLWRLAARPFPYPYLIDALVVCVPLSDVVWNTFDAYDRVWWWDDVVHLANAVVIASVSGLGLRRYAVEPVIRFLLVIGLGMTLAVGWELAEYPTFVQDSPELATAYRDTLSDLGLALIGSTLAAALTVRRSAPGPNRPEPALAGCP